MYNCMTSAFAYVYLDGYVSRSKQNKTCIFEIPQFWWIQQPENQRVIPNLRYPANSCHGAG